MAKIAVRAAKTAERRAQGNQVDRIGIAVTSLPITRIRSSPSVLGLQRDEIRRRERLAVQDALNVPERVAGDVRHVVEGRAGDVGRQHETRGADAKERMIGRRRLPAEDVDARAAQCPGLERLGQRDLVHDLAPRRVDDDRPAPEPGDALSREHAPAWRGCRERAS